MTIKTVSHRFFLPWFIESYARIFAFRTRIRISYLESPAAPNSSCLALANAIRSYCCCYYCAQIAICLYVRTTYACVSVCDFALSVNFSVVLLHGVDILICQFVCNHKKIIESKLKRIGIWVGLSGWEHNPGQWHHYGTPQALGLAQQIINKHMYILTNYIYICLYISMYIVHVHRYINRN